MKRFFCAMLICVTLFLCCVPSLAVFAQEQSPEKDNTQETFEDVLSFSCTYDTESKKVSINGTMRYEVFSEHKNSKILIYAVPPGASEYAVARSEKPIAQADASIRFDFTFSNREFLDQYSKYAIFLRSPNGELTLGTEAQYPEVESKVDRENAKTDFKGIVGSESSYYSDIDADTVFVPVYLDELFTNASGGYVYHLDSSQLFFSKSYVDRLDTLVTSFSVSGAKVYLQYLLKDGSRFGATVSDSAEFYLPNVHNGESLLLVHALTDFLMLRYNEAKGPRISGIVLGKSWDDHARSNSCAAESVEDYAQRCADYAIAVASSARSVDPSIDVILPFSTQNFKTDDSFEGVPQKTFSVKKLIESLMEYFDNSLGDGMDCAFLLECDEMPFGISNENIVDGIDLAYDAYEGDVHVGSTSAFSSYLKDVCDRYTSGSKSYIFKLNVPADIDGNALSCTYAYSYYRLRRDASIISFVVDLSAGKSERISDIYRIAKYIDTPDGAPVTKALLGFFGKNSWDDIIKNALKTESGIKSVYTQAPMEDLPEAVKGSFKYFDFSSSYSTDGWYRGIGCQSLKIAYASSDRKALSALLNLKNESKSEILYHYENYESFNYTPYLKLELQISDGAQNSLYEVSVLCENSQTRLETFCTVKGNEMTELVLNLSDIEYIGSIKNVEDLKISVRSLTGEAESCTLWLYGISGHSIEYASDKLESLIEKEREKINSANEEDDKEEQGDVVLALLIVVISGLLGIGIFAVFKKDGGSNKNE